ncbi:MAG: transposase family protein [Eubacterium sp.]|nr:transposase family protein [Eubacterium sp.]
MQELLTLLDKDLVYDGHEMVDGSFVIAVHFRNPVCKCRYCGKESSSVHSTYQRSVQDLPIQGHTTTLLLTARKMFCKNPSCTHTTFSETFPFIGKSAKKTDRLKEQIISVALETSSVAAADTLKRGAIQTSKSTICLLLKKIAADVDN